MGNGALPHGPSYRAHPRLYLNRPSARPPEGLLTEMLRKHIRAVADRRPWHYPAVRYKAASGRVLKVYRTI
jgi:hypothetical protein